MLALLPVAFISLRACFPPIGGSEPREEPSQSSSHCATCHEPAFASWASSRHAKAERTVDAPPPHPIGEIDVKALGGRVIGVDPLWQFLIPGRSGRIQVADPAWDPKAREWFTVFGDRREPGDWGHWSGGAMTWNSQCAACHNTGVDKGYDFAADRYSTTLGEHGVGCVACHGNQRAHLGGAPPTILTREQTEDACASCHSLRAELTGTFTPGDRFLDHFAPTLVGLDETFLADGQIAAESFEYTAWQGSRMRAAGVSCTDCHDPHSTKLRRQGDALCLGCHQAHEDFHPPDTVACQDCHMPTTVYMQRDPRHDHGFPIPDLQAGTDASLRACRGCHSDQDTSWLRAKAAAWWPDQVAPQRAFSVAMAKARKGDASATPTLLALLQDPDERPGWRAAAASALSLWVEDGQVLQALLATVDDPEDVVRFAISDALAAAAHRPSVQRALGARLQDPRRAVRVQATRALRGYLQPRDPRLEDYANYLAHNADQPAALHEWAGWMLEQHRPDAAQSLLERAILHDRGSPPLYDALAITHAMRGAPLEAARSLRQAIALTPSDPHLWLRLGLAEAEAHAPERAIQALEEAIQLSPNWAKAHYNLGLARVQHNAVGGGIKNLQQAVRLEPSDIGYRYGLAATLWDHGRHQEARAEATRVLEQAPQHRGALAILNRETPAN